MISFYEEDTILKVTIAKYTELGSRERNEDFFSTASTQNHHFFALADGLGGHGLGDEASQLVCETAIKHFLQNPQVNNTSFDTVYNICQDKLLAKQEEVHATGKMRTTLNLLCLDETTAYWSHIGDSRTYYFANGELVKRTFDHSVPQMLAAIGELEDAEIRFHEDRNRLLRVLGVAGQTPSFEVETPIPLTGNQQFLLCSDGFWEFITEEQILLCLDESDNPQLWIDNMIELVHKNSRDKNADNTTVIAVWIEGE